MTGAVTKAGARCSLPSWLPFHGLLAAAGFEVIAPDHPGVGKSDDFPEVEAIDDLVYHYAKAGAAPPEDQQLAVTTASVYAVETCADVVSDLFRYGGGRVLALTNPMQRHLRNSLAARQHVALSEEHYEAAGRHLLESAKARRS